MQLAQILLVLTALAVIGIEVTSFRLPLQIPTSLSSWLPFTFNVTKDPTGLGSVTLNVKPKLVGQVGGPSKFLLTLMQTKASFRFKQPK